MERWGWRIIQGKFTSLRSKMSAADFNKCQAGGVFGEFDDTGFEKQSIITVVDNLTKITSKRKGAKGAKGAKGPWEEMGWRRRWA